MNLLLIHITHVYINLNIFYEEYNIFSGLISNKALPIHIKTEVLKAVVIMVEAGTKYSCNMYYVSLWQGAWNRAAWRVGAPVDSTLASRSAAGMKNVHPNSSPRRSPACLFLLAGLETTDPPLPPPPPRQSPPPPPPATGDDGPCSCCPPPAAAARVDNAPPQAAQRPSGSLDTVPVIIITTLLRQDLLHRARRHLSPTAAAHDMPRRQASGPRPAAALLGRSVQARRWPETHHQRELNLLLRPLLLSRHSW